LPTGQSTVLDKVIAKAAHLSDGILKGRVYSFSKGIEANMQFGLGSQAAYHG
jgi:hypothetical protein